MKKILLLLVLSTWGIQLGGLMAQQNPPPGWLPQQLFDPERDPVAIREGDAVQLFVSEYVLSKSVRARIGRQAQVDKVYQMVWTGAPYLVVEGRHPSDNGMQTFKFNIPLMPDASGRFLYASATAQACNGPCGNCGTNPADCGCCTTSNGRSGQTIPSPLLKVTTTTE